MTIKRNSNEFLDLLKDKSRLDFLASFHGSMWLRLFVNDETGKRLTRNEIDRRMATEPPGFGE
jgi:hypothetical protein